MGLRRAIAAGLLMGLLAACGANSTDPFRRGRSIYGDICSSCHGSAGDGGVGPSLHEVLETWPDCGDHVEWISLGSDGWEERYGDRYGAVDKEVKGGMPAQGDSLGQDEIELVAAFERIQYGGEDEAAAFDDCGVAVPGDSTTTSVP